jgi:transcription initiation factor TFIIIB Brf1 subunit/transcription initiation factor TFIIB
VVWTYKKLLKDGVLSGLSLETRAAAILYYIFRDNGISRNLIEVCNANNSHPRQVAKAARKIARAFRKPWVLSQRNITQEVQKYCDQLGTNQEYTAGAIKIANLMHQIAEQRYMNVGKGFTAGCIYCVTQFTDMNLSYRTQSEISDTVGITEVTLRTNYKKMLTMVNLTREAIKELTLEEFLEGAYEYVGEE